MSCVNSKYTVIREYKNERTLNELLQRIICIHIGAVNIDIKQLKGCSDHEVYENDE